MATKRGSVAVAMARRAARREGHFVDSSTGTGASGGGAFSSRKQQPAAAAILSQVKVGGNQEAQDSTSTSEILDRKSVV